MSTLQLVVVSGVLAVGVASALAAAWVRRARRRPVPHHVAEPEPVAASPAPMAGIDVATAAITSLQQDDALLVCELAGLDRLRADEGHELVETLQIQLGRHLGDRLLDDEVVARFEGDAFVVVLRNVTEPLDHLVRRIIETWAVEHPTRRLHIGAARHAARSSPLDTAESARAALFAAQRQ